MSDELAIKIYESINSAHEDRDFLHWHCSSIAECPRSHYFKRLGVPPVSLPTASKMLRWDAGHYFEAALRPHLVNIYPDLASNNRLTSEKMDLTGEYDNYSEQHELLVEVKTVGPRAPRYRKVSESRHHLREDSPYLAHEFQNHAYVLLLREKGLPVKNINYVYITLEGLIITYETVVNEAIVGAVMRRLAVLSKAWKTQEPPLCICMPDHPLWGSTMQFCNYKREGRDCCSVELLSEFKQGKEKILNAK